MSDIVLNLKGFSNADLHEHELADINKVIQNVCKIANSEIRKKQN